VQGPAAISDQVLRGPAACRFARMFAVVEFDEFCADAMPSDAGIEYDAMSVDEILTLSLGGILERTHGFSRRVRSRAAR
jgi:hypothetical protein